MKPARRIIFGVYPGGVTGTDTGLISGPPDDPARIKACLNHLSGGVRPFVIRCYDSFQDPDSRFVATRSAPLDFEQYAVPGARPLDLVLQFRSATGNIPGYLDFVREQLERRHRHLYSVQITEEANFRHGPDVIDGPYPNVLHALVDGVVAAKEILITLGRPDVKVGFNATPTFGPDAGFWSSLKDLNPNFADAVDYVGLDCFPDVFRPAADLRSSLIGVLETMRQVWLPAAGIPDRAPIHITEHGWPTPAGRSFERQADVLEIVIRAIHEVRERLNIERYTLFSLRDADIANPANRENLFSFFGITTADYAPKPAYAVFRRLIQDLGN